jgi:hypothetical protein
MPAPSDHTLEALQKSGGLHDSAEGDRQSSPSPGDPELVRRRRFKSDLISWINGLVDAKILSHEEAEFRMREELDQLRHDLLHSVVFDQGLTDPLDVYSSAHSATPESASASHSYEKSLMSSDPCDIYSSASGLPTQLPAQAPQLYKERPRDESIVEFLRRVWRPWIEARLLSRADLRRFDPQAYTALYNWRQIGGLPEDVRLPTLREVNDRRLREGGIGDLRALRLVESRLRRGTPVPPMPILRDN